MNELQQQLEFLREIDRLKAVYRKALVKCDDNRYENSAEHSWHIALAANTLKQYVSKEVNITRVLIMLLLHDIVEIDAGDTFAFGEQADLEAQHEKELAALERIMGILPAQQAAEYKALWIEFEDAKTDDAMFAKSMDRILPLIQNVANNGGSWAQNTVRKTQVLNRNKHLKEIAPALWDDVVEQVDNAVEQGWLIND